MSCVIVLLHLPLRPMHIYTIPLRVALLAPVGSCGPTSSSSEPDMSLCILRTSKPLGPTGAENEYTEFERTWI